MCTTASFAPSSLLSSRFSNGTVSFVCLLSAREVFLKSRDAVLELCSRDFYAWLLWKMMIFFSQLRSARCWLRGGGAREREKRRATKLWTRKLDVFTSKRARFSPSFVSRVAECAAISRRNFSRRPLSFWRRLLTKGRRRHFLYTTLTDARSTFSLFQHTQVPEHLPSKRPPPQPKNQCPVFNSTSKPSKTKSLERSSPKRNARTTRRESRKSPRASKKSER